MKANIISYSTGIVVAGVFLLIVLTPPCAFNFLPFALHEAFFREVMKESHFIIAFDILVSIVLSFLAFKLTKRIIKKIN